MTYRSTISTCWAPRSDDSSMTAGSHLETQQFSSYQPRSCPPPKRYLQLLHLAGARANKSQCIGPLVKPKDGIGILGTMQSTETEISGGIWDQRGAAVSAIEICLSLEYIENVIALVSTGSAPRILAGLDALLE